MENLFSAFVSRRYSNDSQNSRSDDTDQPCTILKKRTWHRRPSFGRRSSTNSDPIKLISIVDAQLMQIKEKLAAFRDQDTQFRERMDSLNDSVSQLTSSQSSFTPSECSDLGSLDEVYEEEEEELKQQTAGQSKGKRALVKGNRNHFNQPPAVRCHYMRRATSDPSLLYSHIELPEEDETMEIQRHSTYSADQAINLYPQYDNPEEISTLF